MIAAFCICILCIPTAAQPSLLSWPIESVREFAVTEKMGTHLLVENRLSLTTISRLLPVITALPLCEQSVLALLVLGHFMRSKTKQPIVRRSIL